MDFQIKIYNPGPYNLVSNRWKPGLFRTIGYVMTPQGCWLESDSPVANANGDLEYTDFPELRELQEWFTDSFGPCGTTWTAYYDIDDYAITRHMIRRGVPRHGRTLVAQYHVAETSQLALFKLRWHP